jgi:hypothetical protein
MIEEYLEFWKLAVYFDHIFRDNESVDSEASDSEEDWQKHFKYAMEDFIKIFTYDYFITLGVQDHFHQRG